MRHPSGWIAPGFLIGPRHDVVLWGFTAGIVSRLLDFLGWTRPWNTRVMRDLPAYMLQGGARPAQPPPAQPPAQPRERP